MAHPAAALRVAAPRVARVAVAQAHLPVDLLVAPRAVQAAAPEAPQAAAQVEACQAVVRRLAVGCRGALYPAVVDQEIKPRAPEGNHRQDQQQGAVAVQVQALQAVTQASVTPRAVICRYQAWWMNNPPLAALPRALASRVDPQMGQVAQLQVRNQVRDKVDNRHRTVVNRAIKAAARADHRLQQREVPWWPLEPMVLGRVLRVD